MRSISAVTRKTMSFTSVLLKRMGGASQLEYYLSTSFRMLHFLPFDIQIQQDFCSTNLLTPASRPTPKSSVLLSNICLTPNCHCTRYCLGSSLPFINCRSEPDAKAPLNARRRVIALRNKRKNGKRTGPARHCWLPICQEGSGKLLHAACDEAATQGQKRRLSMQSGLHVPGYILH